MERKQFTFYDSYFKAISRIKDPQVRCEAYDVICRYALLGEEPDLDALPDAAAIAFEGARPNLDASARKAAAGKSGGEKSKNSEANSKQAQASCKQTQAKRKQTEAKRKQEKEQEKEKEKDKEQMLYNPPKSPQGDAFVLFSDGNKELLTALHDFASMRKKTNRPLTDRAKQMLLSKLKKLSSDPAVQAKILDQSTYHGWQDVYELKEVDHGTDREIPAEDRFGLIV